jgi:hypothetical protein
MMAGSKAPPMRDEKASHWAIEKFLARPTYDSIANSHHPKRRADKLLSS